MKNYKLIIFDWDGTLVDSRKKIFNSIRHGCKVNGLPNPTDQQLIDQIGLSLQISYQNLFPKEKNLPVEKLIQGYEDYFFAHPEDSQLFDGTKKTLEQLEEQGYLLAIATGKRRQALDHDLENFDIKHHFVITRTPVESPSKPNPQMLFDILEFTGCDSKDALMVGDSIFDLQMAENANMDAAAVSFGIQPINVLKKYHHSMILDNISDLTKIGT